MRVICTLFLAFAYANQQLTLDEISDEIEISKGSSNTKHVFYSIPLKSKIYDDDNLIVKVMTDDPFSDPNIYMSFTMKEPNDKSEFKCSAAGKDTCTLSGAQLQHGLSSDKLVYIGVYCQN